MLGTDSIPKILEDTITQGRSTVKNAGQVIGFERFSFNLCFDPAIVVMVERFLAMPLPLKGPRSDLLATTTEMEKAVADGKQVIDARTEDYYLGAKYKKTYVSAAGHIPTAKDFPHDLLVNGGGESHSAKVTGISAEQPFYTTPGWTTTKQTPSRA